MDTAISILIGISLAASCGFRVFVPLLVTSAAALSGYLPLTSSFEWMGTWPALAAFGVASLVEIGAYYIPWLDHALDTIASPVGVLAGVLLFAASATDLDPFWRWSLAIIAGGGSAGIVQGGTVATRAASTSVSGGLTNFIVSTIEAAAGFVVAVLAIVAPIFAAVVLLLVVAAMYYLARPALRAFFAPRSQA